MLCQILYNLFLIFVSVLEVERKEEKTGGRRRGKYCLLSLMILPYGYM
jgi:hypothetical protein